jgi:uncharacterized protein (DUF1800 family)
MLKPAPQKKPSTGQGPWAPYAPDRQAPWDLRRVVHLHRRAAFAATWHEIQRDLEDGPGPSVDRLLAGKARSEGVPEGFQQTARLLGEAAVGSRDAGRLKAWWLYRMLFSPDPLTERLVLMWHNHFATSNLKVADPRAMHRQNEVFRCLAKAPFGQLLNKVVRDPALLVWLDAQVNRKGHPNENLARELMELFTLGIGSYSEKDVKEAARALTGWGVNEDAFEEVSARHDPGEKTILGKQGKWKGDDLVKMLLEHRSTADRLAWRICKVFMGEKAVDRAGLAALADGLRRHDLKVGWAVETVLRSRAFFAEANIRRRVQGPVGYVVGAARALELFEPPSSTLVLGEWCGRLGQDLFYPPNVAGWPGGRSWLTSRALIGRANYAAALVEGTRVGRPAPMDPLALARRHGQGKDRHAVLDFYTRLLLGIEPAPAWRQRLVSAAGPDVMRKPEAARKLVGLILALPEAQVH